MNKQEKKNKNFWIIVEHSVFGLIMLSIIFYLVNKYMFPLNLFSLILVWLLLNMLVFCIILINVLTAEYRWYK